MISITPPISWWFSLSPWVVESGSVETEGAIPVDCTATIKLVLG